ncbi:hypothetical protein D3C80_1775550 [compost metagenome]
MIRVTTALTPTRMRPMNCTSRAPARNNMPREVTNITTTEPRSGWASSKMATTNSTAMGFMKPMKRSRTSL